MEAGAPYRRRPERFSSRGSVTTFARFVSTQTTPEQNRGRDQRASVHARSQCRLRRGSVQSALSRGKAVAGARADPRGSAARRRCAQRVPATNATVTADLDRTRRTQRQGRLLAATRCCRQDQGEPRHTRVGRGEVRRPGHRRIAGDLEWHLVRERSAPAESRWPSAGDPPRRLSDHARRPSGDRHQHRTGHRHGIPRLADLRRAVQGPGEVLRTSSAQQPVRVGRSDDRSAGALGSHQHPQRRKARVHPTGDVLDRRLRRRSDGPPRR